MAASTLAESVIRYGKKLDRTTDENLILAIIHKLSKVPVTVDLLQETGIGKVVRGLAKKPGKVGEKASAVLHNWRKVVASAQKIDSPPSQHEKHSSNKEKRANPKNGCASKYSPKPEQTFSSSSHSHKSNHKSNGSSMHFQDDTSEYRTKESSKSNLSSQLERKQKNSPVEDIELKNKKQKHEFLQKSSHSNTTYEKERKNANEPSKDLTHRHENKSHESKKTKESKKCKDSEKKSSSVKKTLGKVGQSTDAFTSSEARFEDCLSFNDIVPVKRKKSSKASSSNSKSHDEKITMVNGESKSHTKSSKHKSSERTSSVHHSSKEAKSERTSSVHHSSKEVKSERTSSIHHSSKEAKPKDVSSKKERSEQLPLPVVKTEKVDIASTLPQPQLNYRPLPQRNFDCFPVKRKALTNEDAIKFTSSKKEKTVVYSGRRNFLTAVPTLQESCTRILIEHIDAIEYVGELPYYILKPVLERCTPHQLVVIEDFNPSLLEDTRELWEIHCKKDFRTHKPQESETWRDLYMRAFDEREKRLQAITRNISAAMTKSTTASRSVKLTYVDSYVKPPRDVARKQERNGTGLPVNHTMKAGPPSKASPRPTAPAINSAAVSNAKADFVPRNAKPKVAPLMAKTLKSMKQCFRR